MLAKVTRIIGVGFVLLMIASVLVGGPALAKSQWGADEQLAAVPAELMPPGVDDLTPITMPPAAITGAINAGQEEPAALAPLQAAVTFDLCASAGTVTMPGSPSPISVPIWGFSNYTGTACDPAQLPGPTLEVTAGDTVTINLHNQLAENVSIIFPGQDVIPDVVGAAQAGVTTYTFTASNPGTYLYEAGTNATKQVPMGLYGALIVRPATPGQAYDGGPGAASAYDQEAVLVLSEIDPALNADPANFNMFDYAPKYWLINGKAYPNTDLILGNAGDRVLLRYLNAGSTNHTMSLLGMHQRVIATDAFSMTYPFDVVAQTIPSGQTADMIATIPSDASAGDQFPLYNRQLHITNGDLVTGGTAHFPGGMMTFLEVPTAVPLASNWNLMSVPLEPGAGAAGGAAGSIAGISPMGHAAGHAGVSPAQLLSGIDYDRVYAFQGCDAADPWKLYDPDLPATVNDLNQIDVTMGLWVKMNSPDTLAVAGSEPARTDIPLCAGWNLVGYPSLTARPVAEVLASVAGQVQRVYYFDATDAADPWKMYDTSAPAFVNDLAEFKPGGGYWFLVSQDTVLTIQNK